MKKRGVPLNKMRTVLLDIFKRTYANNDMEYETILKVVFNNHVPTSFKNVPTFSENENLEEILVVNYLNEKGIAVISHPKSLQLFSRKKIYLIFFF